MILALDIAIRTGWATADQSAVADFSQYADDEPRLFHYFYHWLHDALVDMEILVKERNWLGINRSADRLCVLNGIARMTAYERGCTIVEVTPAAWRKAVLGDGNLKRKAAKNAAISHANQIRQYTDHHITDDNEAEAICLLAYHTKVSDARAEKRASRTFQLPTGA